ncbi:DNA-directed RNA polymerase subunit beta [Nocardia sp. NPDC051787]|uniref:DNA-directed RNA polymerase subunit beta n=1 Tax=Nocardia sp. NPDC051787 TaxID=3155415 RepID=UPI00342E65D4
MTDRTTDLADDDTVVLADTPVSRCQFYQRVCGLPARIDPQMGRIFVLSGSVGAITVPAQLGALVKNHLNQAAPAGPIISHPRSKRWTFLIRPDVRDEMPLFTELFRLNATLSPIGAQIALPSPADDAGAVGFRLWAQAPRDSYRPSGLAAIEAIRAGVRARPGRRR